MKIGEAIGAVAAASGDTHGRGKARLYIKNGDHIVPTNEVVDVSNIYDSSVRDGRKVTLEQIGPNWYIVSADI